MCTRVADGVAERLLIQALRVSCAQVRPRDLIGSRADRCVDERARAVDVRHGRDAVRGCVALRRAVVLRERPDAHPLRRQLACSSVAERGDHLPHG